MPVKKRKGAVLAENLAKFVRIAVIASIVRKIVPAELVKPNSSLKKLLILLFVFFAIPALAQEEEDGLDPVVNHSIPVSIASPSLFLKLGPTLNPAITFESKNHFFLFGPEFWLPKRVNTGSASELYEGWGFHFSYGRFLSRNYSRKGYYLLFNFRYEDIDDYFEMEITDGVTRSIFKERLWYEVYEGVLGLGLKVPLNSHFYFDIMTGGGVSLNLDYTRVDKVQLQPAIMVRGGLGYRF